MTLIGPSSIWWPLYYAASLKTDETRIKHPPYEIWLTWRYLVQPVPEQSADDMLAQIHGAMGNLPQ